MSNRARPSEEDTRRLVVAITDFLRDQLVARTDLVPEDRDCLEIAIQCLEMAYGLDPDGYIQLRFSRPLLDIFTQVTNPVPVKDKLRAEALKDEGNSYVRRSMYQEAETAYTNAIELDRWNSIYYCNRASARISQQNYFEAISDCRQALMLNPDYAKAHAKMGQSYALLQRPREAVRCFRQAADLEPNNERYRNNLRVAENQITRPDAMGLITNLLSSIFGLNTDHSGNSNVTLPASFMIITESHPTPQNILPTESTEQGTETGREESGKGSHDTAIPLRYGVVDEGAEEQSVVDMDLPDSIEVRRRGGSTQEFILEIPLFGVTQEDHPTPCTCERHSALENAALEQETSHKRDQISNSNKADTNAVSREKENEESASTGTRGSVVAETVKEITDTEEASQNAKQEQASSYNGERFHDEAHTAGIATLPYYPNFKSDSIEDKMKGKTERKNNESGNRLVQTEEGKDIAGWAEVDFTSQNEFSRNNKQDSSELKLLSVEEEAARTIPYHMQQEMPIAGVFPPIKENVDTSVSVGDKNSGLSTSDCTTSIQDRKASVNEEKSAIQNSESTVQEKVNKENLEEKEHVSQNEKKESIDDTTNQN